MKLIRSMILSAVAGATVVWLARNAPRTRAGTAAQDSPVERRADPDPDALVAASLTDRVGVDVSRMKDLAVPQLQPLVEYLTYIQVQRGGATESLVFVRSRDMEAMAGIAGAPDGSSLMNEFQRLGVAVTMN